MLAVSLLDAALAGLGVITLIAVPYWILYRIFRHDTNEQREDGT